MPTAIPTKPLTKKTLVQVRDSIENIKAVIDVSIAAIRDTGGNDCDNIALVLHNHAYVPLKEVGQQLDAAAELSHE